MYVWFCRFYNLPPDFIGYIFGEGCIVNARQMSTIIHLSQCYPKTHFFQKTKHFCCWCRHAFATYICCLFKWIEYENLIDFLSYDSSGYWKSSVLVLILILVLLIWRNLCSGRCVYAHQVCSPIKMITNRNTQKISNTKIKNLCSRAYNALSPPLSTSIHVHRVFLYAQESQFFRQI